MERNVTKLKTRIPALILCIAVSRLSVGVPVPQDEPSKPESSSAKKQVEKKATIDVHIVVSAQGKQVVPSGSRIDLQGNKTCKDVQRLQHSIGKDGGATFVDLPICKITLAIYITGFDTGFVSVDLADYKDPMRILVKSNGPPVIVQ